MMSMMEDKQLQEQFPLLAQVHKQFYYSDTLVSGFPDIEASKSMIHISGHDLITRHLVARDSKYGHML